MQVRPASTHDSTSPCPSSARRSAASRGSGLARLEFALTVAVLGVIAAFALDHVASLQVSARSAEHDTTAAQARSRAALAEARGASATLPCPNTPAQAAPSGTLPSAETPLSCP